MSLFGISGGSCGEEAAEPTFTLVPFRGGEPTSASRRELEERLAFPLTLPNDLPGRLRVTDVSARLGPDGERAAVADYRIAHNDSADLFVVRVSEFRGSSEPVPGAEIYSTLNGTQVHFGRARDGVGVTLDWSACGRAFSLTGALEGGLNDAFFRAVAERFIVECKGD